MNPAIASVLLGLSSALVWGAGDFCGGLGTRRASVLGVLMVAELSGLVLLVAMALALHEPLPTLNIVLFSIIAGISGTVGLAALYRGLAVGRASIVAPLSAVVAALVAGIYSVVTLGLPDNLKLIGFVIALVAIVLVSQSAGSGQGTSSLALAGLAGLGFGAFFVFIHLAGSESNFVPLAIARGIAIPLVFAVALVRGFEFPPKEVLPIIILSGILDAGGNVLFLFAGQFGRLDIATILSSLYPASTVILSRFILNERTTRLQQVGVIAALVAVALIAI